jgi:hypothetical protein
MSDLVYTVLRQRVLRQLPPAAQAQDVLQLIAHAAICGGVGHAPRDGTRIDDLLEWVQGHLAAAPGGPGRRGRCAASQWTSASKTRTSRGSSSTRISATNPRTFRRSRAAWPASGSS